MQRLAAQRLADLVAPLKHQDWEHLGRFGAHAISIEELVSIALHRSQARLTNATICR
jgi:hypothetical protein